MTRRSPTRSNCRRLHPAWFVVAAALAGAGCRERPREAAAPAPASSSASEARAHGAASGAPGAGAPPSALDQASSACAGCHAEIVREWSESMHAQSTRERDPLYRAMTDKAVGVLGDRARARCAGCHYPDSVERLPLTPEEVAALAPHEAEGVGCTTCHAVPAGHPGIRWSEEAAVGWRRARDGVPDPAQAVCLSCHAEMKNPEGHDVCTTGAETERYRGGERCVDCHMEPVAGAPWVGAEGRERHASHVFPGGRSLALLKRAAELELHWEAGPAGAPGTLLVQVRAGRLGHAFATGTPLRQVFVRVRLQDGQGDVVWQSATDDPLAEDPEAVFARVFRDGEGRGPVPPFMAEGPASDSRLMPHEVRSLRYPTPPEARRATVTLEYRLAPDPLLKAAGLPTGTTVVHERTLELAAPR